MERVESVRFVSPQSYGAALGPFVPVLDERGRRFDVAGLVGLLWAIQAAKSDRSVKVACRHQGKNTFRVLRWF